MKISKNPKTANELLGKKRVMKSVKSSKISRDELRVKPVLGISTIKKEDKNPSKTVRLSAIKSILRDGIDPSTVGEMSFPLISPREAMQGLSQDISSSRTKRRQSRRVRRKKTSRYNIKRVKAHKAARSRALVSAKRNQNTKNITHLF